MSCLTDEKYIGERKERYRVHRVPYELKIGSPVGRGCTRLRKNCNAYRVERVLSSDFPTKPMLDSSIRQCTLSREITSRTLPCEEIVSTTPRPQSAEISHPSTTSTQTCTTCIGCQVPASKSAGLVRRDSKSALVSTRQSPLERKR